MSVPSLGGVVRAEVRDAVSALARPEMVPTEVHRHQTLLRLIGKHVA